MLLLIQFRYRLSTIVTYNKTLFLLLHLGLLKPKTPRISRKIHITHHPKYQMFNVRSFYVKKLCNYSFYRCLLKDAISGYVSERLSYLLRFYHNT